MNTLLLFLPTEGRAEPWAVLVGAEGVGYRGPLDETQAKAARTILVVPGAQALARWVELPTRNDAQARAAAAYLLEDDLAAPKGATHFALGPFGGDGGRMVVAVDRARMADWVAQAQGLGVRPDGAIPDHLLLPEPDGDSVAFALPMGDAFALRAKGFAATAERDLAPLLAGERALQLIEDEAEVDALLVAAARAPAINLLQGEFAPRDEAAFELASFRIPLILAAVVLLLPLLSLGLEAARHNAAADAARARAENLARDALPNATTAPDPVGLALERLRSLDAAQAGGFLAPASGLFAAVQEVPNARLTSLRYTPDGTLRASVSYVEYADMERLRAGLAQARLQLEEGAAATSGDRTVSEIIVRAAP